MSTVTINTEYLDVDAALADVDALLALLRPIATLVEEGSAHPYCRHMYGTLRVDIRCGLWAIPETKMEPSNADYIRREWEEAWKPCHDIFDTFARETRYFRTSRGENPDSSTLLDMAHVLSYCDLVLEPIAYFTVFLRTYFREAHDAYVSNRLPVHHRDSTETLRPAA